MKKSKNLFGKYVYSWKKINLRKERLYLKKLLKSIYENIVNEKEIKIVGDSTVNELVSLDNKEGTFIFLTIADNKSRALVIHGNGKGILDAINLAIKKYKNEKEADFFPNSIKLDIVYNLEETKPDFNISRDEIIYEMGSEGIALDPELEMAFMPQEILAYQLITKSSGKLNILNLLNALSRKMGNNLNNFTEQLDNHYKLKLYKFRTKSFYYDKDTYCQLYKGHQEFKSITKTEIWNAIELSKDNYFKKVVRRNGKFIYVFQPHINQREKRYNILRHAGTAYSMLETYQLIPDEEILKLADNSLEYLIKRQKVIEFNKEKYTVVVERDYYKLGGNALAIVAMAKYTQITGDDKYIPNMQSMASWMKATQDNSGVFTAHKQNYSTGEIADFTSHFYPGEAILSLVRLYQIDKNEEWLDLAEKAATYLIEERDKGININSVRPDHWLMYGLNDLYRVRSKDIYLKHSIFMAQAILNKQLNKDTAESEEFVGGFRPRANSKPGLTNNACWSEGLLSAYALAVDYGYDDFALEIKQALNSSMKFQLRGQLRPESVMHFKNKSLCLGGFHKNLGDYEIRNDYTQHNISSLIGYYNILDSEK